MRYFKKELPSNPLYLPNGQQVRFRTSSSGVGILATNQPKLLEQLDNLSRRGVGGLLEINDTEYRTLLGGEKGQPSNVVDPKTLIRTLLGSGKNVFYHSGDLGDIIYSLPTVRELGGGDMVLGEDNRTRMATREKMTPERMKIIAPLLACQSYISSVQHHGKVPPQCYDLNQMRNLLRSERLDMQPGFNLARCYLRAFGLKLENDHQAWLHNITPKPIEPVIIARSPRYRNSAFLWDRILREYRGKLAFVGTKEEHQDFESRVGPVTRYETNDLLELAEVIAGCELFVGNQSCPYAIAEGLKKRAILEICPYGSNTLFERPEVLRECSKGNALPSIGRTMPKSGKKKALIVAGPVDWYTGLGRITCQIIEEAVRKKFAVSVQAASTDPRLPVPAAVKAAMKQAQVDGPRICVTPLLDAEKNCRIGDIVLTMWESTRPPADSIRILNSRASKLIVPSRFCAETFSAAGYVGPIQITAPGISVIRPEIQYGGPPVTAGRPKETKLTFGAAGRLAHGGTRKGIEDVITCFQQAFPEPGKAVLKLKLFDDCKTPEFAHPDIQVEGRMLDDKLMAAWYSSLDCFVCLSKGEGWGLHVQEAAAYGIPVIAPSFSGLADQVRNILPFTIVPAGEGYQGHWCQPDLKAVVSMMECGTFIVLDGPIRSPAKFFDDLIQCLE